MMKPTFIALFLLAGSGLLATSAWAQMPRGLPSDDKIAHADTYQAPKVGDYAAKLAQQPDLMGQWSAMEPKGAGVGPTFDPAHTFYPPQPPEGEALFGPVPGTYVQGIPYTPEYRKKYQDLIKETTEGKSRDTYAACVPYGVPRMVGGGVVIMDIIQSPDVMLWYNAYSRDLRRIFLDGRKHPGQKTAQGDDAHSRSGHSVGHWEGDTLVVDTVNMLAGYFDETPAPYSDQISMVERIRLIDTNIFEDKITITDPVAMERPWLVTRYFQRSGFGPGGPGGPPPGGPAGAPGGPGGPPPGGPGGPTAGGPAQGGPLAAAAAPGSNQTVHRYFDLTDQPCVPNVKFDENGFQVAILPQELEAAPKPVQPGR